PWEIVSNYLSQGKALFLFDGLDEVPEKIRPELVDIIANFRFDQKLNVRQLIFCVNLRISV
ncbi:MAG: hypothetical protein U9R10_02085, partial [Euryarchaeota archaeon]|nr:hypothetical protein [Euryarchaeota archaeon]